MSYTHTVKIEMTVVTGKNVNKNRTEQCWLLFTYRVSHETWHWLREEIQYRLWPLCNLKHSFFKLIFEAIGINKHKIPLVLAFPKCGLPFWSFQTFWKCHDYGSFVINVSRTIHFKVGWQRLKRMPQIISIIKDDMQAISLFTVIFRGTLWFKNNILLILKGTSSVFQSDPLCKCGNAGFTTVSL